VLTQGFHIAVGYLKYRVPQIPWEARTMGFPAGYCFLGFHQKRKGGKKMKKLFLATLIVALATVGVFANGSKDQKAAPAAAASSGKM